MNRFNWIEVNNMVILKQNFSNLNDLELSQMLKKSNDTLKERGESEVIVVTNADGVIFSAETLDQICKIFEKNKPFVSASAFYNVTEYQKSAILSAAQMTNRSFLMFHDEEAVNIWLDSLK